MELDFRNCETKEDVKKVFKEKEEELKRLRHIFFPEEGEKES